MRRCLPVLVVPFDPPRDHGDAIVLDAQEWLRTGYAVAAPVTELVERSGLPERTFKRRFARATGYSPIAYVQHVRVEEAKRRLERTSAPVDEIESVVPSVRATRGATTPH